MTFLDIALKAFSYIAVFWAGYFIACAMVVSKRADEEETRAVEAMRDGSIGPDAPQRAG